MAVKLLEQYIWPNGTHGGVFMRKNYVIDSSLFIFDPNCISHFMDNNVIIPNCEIRELERLKEGSKKPMIRYQATEALEFIREATKHDLNYNICGVNISNGIVLYILSSDKNLETNNNQKEILDVVVKAQKEILDEAGHELKTVLVSRVLSLRYRAKSCEIAAEDYMADKILADNMFSGMRELSFEDDGVSECYNQLYSGDKQTIAKPKSVTLYPNEFVILKDSKGKVVDTFRYISSTKRLKVVRTSARNVYGIKPLNIKQCMALDLLLDPDVQMVSLFGKPGTGKTLLSVAAAFHQTIPVNGQQPIYRRVIFVRPMVAAGEEMGFLPGDEFQKIKPWMGSFYDSIEELVRPDVQITPKKKGKPNSEDGENVENAVEHFLFSNIESGKISLMPTTYMRGRTFHNCFVIVDEAQGITPHIMKMILTRIGKGSKVVIAGDPSDNQIDTELLDTYFNGLICASQNMKSSDFSGIVQFDVEDTERSQFVADVEKMM